MLLLSIRTTEALQPTIQCIPICNIDAKIWSKTRIMYNVSYVAGGFLSFKSYSISRTAPLRTPSGPERLKDLFSFPDVLQEFNEHLKLRNHVRTSAWYLALKYVF